MECAICFELFSSNFMGVGCQQCGKRCCISCDVQSQNCPFCRNKVSWKARFQKINPQIFKHYLRSFKNYEIGKLSRFLQSKKLFIDLMNNCPNAIYTFHRLEDDEDLFNLMIIARDYIFGVASHTKNIDDIDFLLEFIEQLYERLENPDIDLKLDLDTVEELLFSNIKIKKTYPESVKKSKYSPKFHKGMIRTREHYRVIQ
jgi:hypothetical protein